MATKEFKRVGPPCPHCKRPMPVSGVDGSDEAKAKLQARIEKLSLKLATAQGITLVPVVKKAEEGAPAAE